MDRGPRAGRPSRPARGRVLPVRAAPGPPSPPSPCHEGDAEFSDLELRGAGRGQLHLRLLFILSSLFFKSSMFAVEDEDVVMVPEEWVWLESRSECWCCSRDSRS